jgi:hypothetical protein
MPLSPRALAELRACAPPDTGRDTVSIVLGPAVWAWLAEEYRSAPPVTKADAAAARERWRALWGGR